MNLYARWRDVPGDRPAQFGVKPLTITPFDRQ